ncbi:MAG: hypothetical protein WCA28_23180, partial [Bradyrhizobium sp.]
VRSQCPQSSKDLSNFHRQDDAALRAVAIVNKSGRNAESICTEYLVCYERASSVTASSTFLQVMPDTQMRLPMITDDS